MAIVLPRQFKSLFCCLACGGVLSAASVLFADENRSLVDASELQDWSHVRRIIRERASDVQLRQADGMSALHWAAYWKNSRAVQELLQAGATADLANSYGVTPLAIACENGDAEVVAHLLQAGADGKTQLPSGQTVLMVGSRSGNSEVVMSLIQSGSDVNAADKSGQTALMWAAATGAVDTVKLLLQHGADPKTETKIGFTATLFACREGHWPVVDALSQSGVDINAVINLEKTFERAPRRGMSGLLFAIESGHYELAIKLVEAGADPNDQRSGLTPLHSLAWVRKTKVGDNPEGDPPPRGSGNLTALQLVRELVKRGADVNRRLEKGDGGKAQMKPKGSTPFLYAARTADLPLLQALLEAGADPTLGNADGCKPLAAAAGVGVIAVGEEPGSVDEVLEVMEFLIQRGADVNSVDQNGETAMHGAAYRNYPEVVAYLAKHSADSTIWNKKNKYGWTPTMIAQGKRPGSFKPSPETVAAIEAAMSPSRN
jgi:ankyrin repeat protein